MDEEKKIMEKRSSFRGWKERNKGKIHQKRNIIVIAIIVLIFSAFMIYPYWDKANNQAVKDKKKVPSIIEKVNSSNGSKNTSLKPVDTTKRSTNTTNVIKKNTIGKIGVPLISNGFEITVKGVTSSVLYVNVWISVKNEENTEKPFKFGSGTILIDNMGQQYENIKIVRSAEITQTNLSANAMREGAVFFERLKEGRNPKKLILNINDEKVEFMFNGSTI